MSYELKHEALSSTIQELSNSITQKFRFAVSGPFWAR